MYTGLEAPLSSCGFHQCEIFDMNLCGSTTATISKCSVKSQGALSFYYKKCLISSVSFNDLAMSILKFK